jgi:biopolymer transport protein ExbB
MNLWWFIIKGGPVMIPIIFGSIIGLALIIERIFVFKKTRIDNRLFMQEIEQLVKRGEIQMAITTCEVEPGPIADVVKAGLTSYSASAAEGDINFAMQSEGNAQIGRLEKGLTGLGIIVTIEPMLGFLGTIVGLIQAFMNWEKMGANISINLLAAGMYAAMITTAAGLIIAIPYYIAYNWFVKKVQDIAKEMDQAHTKLLQLLGNHKNAKTKINV